MDLLSTLLELAGLALVVAGATVAFGAAAGLVVAGVALLAVGLAMGGR